MFIGPCLAVSDGKHPESEVSRGPQELSRELPAWICNFWTVSRVPTPNTVWILQSHLHTTSFSEQLFYHTSIKSLSGPLGTLKCPFHKSNSKTNTKELKHTSAGGRVPLQLKLSRNARSLLHPFARTQETHWQRTSPKTHCYIKTKYVVRNPPKLLLMMLFSNARFLRGSSAYSEQFSFSSMTYQYENNDSNGNMYLQMWLSWSMFPRCRIQIHCNRCIYVSMWWIMHQLWAWKKHLTWCQIHWRPESIMGQWFTNPHT